MRRYFSAFPRTYTIAARWLLGVCTLWAFALTNPLASETVDRISQSRQLRVCIWPDFYGVTFRNPHTRVLTGIDIDLSQALADDLGVELIYVDSSFSMLTEDLLSGRCDVGMFAIGAIAQRARTLSFSHSYMQSGIYAITTKSQRQVRAWSDIDQTGVIVGVQAASFMEPYMRETLERASLVVVRPPMNREKELQSGRIDVFMTDYPNSRRVLDRNDSIRLISPGPRGEVLPYAYALKPGDQQWLARINKFVDTIKQDGRLERAAQRHGMAPMIIR